MNENIIISFNLLDENNQSVVCDPVVVNVLVDPFYCTEAEVAGEFLKEESFAYYDQIRELIFNGSLEIDSFIELYGISTGLTSQQLFKIKRDYVLCYSIYYLGNLLYLDYMKSSRKEKFLGDVKITLEYENDPSSIRGKSEDAKGCMDGIKRLFESWNTSGSMMNIFVKGELNNSSRSASREWWWNQPYTNIINSPVAATKVVNPKTNTLQKIGSVNTVYYGQF